MSKKGRGHRGWHMTGPARGAGQRCVACQRPIVWGERCESCKQQLRQRQRRKLKR